MLHTDLRFTVLKVFLIFPHFEQTAEHFAHNERLHSFVHCNKYHYCDRIKENTIAKKCSAHDRDEKSIKLAFGKPVYGRQCKKVLPITGHEGPEGE